MAAGHDRPGEFDLISRYLAPLSAGERGAYRLTDDAALIAPRKGCAFVMTADAIVEGVHFLRGDPPRTLAQKALRVNLSDLAAKGARPRAYLMTTAWPSWVTGSWVEEFAAGLHEDQSAFGITLIGGDTVSTPGPLSVSITAMGEVPSEEMLRRSGAEAGDDVWVTGTIGDAGLGLRVAQGESFRVGQKHAASLLGRYRVPQPRVGLASGLRALAHASIDISDGLVADLGHVAKASRTGLMIRAAEIPLSDAAAAALRAGDAVLEDLLSAGDDYEIAFTAAVAARRRVAALSAKTGVRLSRIGEVSGRGAGVSVVAENGKMLQFSRRGFTHF